MLRILGKIQRLGIVTEQLPEIGEPALTEIGEQLKAHIGERFGGSLAIREVDAGSCNGCELEIQALNNPYYSIERFGVHFVASPRHADMLLVTGPVSRHMEAALRHTYAATPEPWPSATAAAPAACSARAMRVAERSRMWSASICAFPAVRRRRSLSCAASWRPLAGALRIAWMPA